MYIESMTLNVKCHNNKIKTYVIHLVLKSPIVCHAKRVDNAGVLVEDQIQTDKLVSIHLMSLGT